MLFEVPTVPNETSTVNETTEFPTTTNSSSESSSSSETSSSTTTVDAETSSTTVDYGPNYPYQTFSIECSSNSLLVINRNITDDAGKNIQDDDTFPVSDREGSSNVEIVRPKVYFEIEQGDSIDEIIIRFDYDMLRNYNGMFLIYYPGFMMSNDVTDEAVRKNVRCVIVLNEEMLIKKLLPSTIYTFCAILRDQIYISPFQCKSNQSPAVGEREPWLYEEQKVCTNRSLIIPQLVYDYLSTYQLTGGNSDVADVGGRVITSFWNYRNVYFNPKNPHFDER